MIKTLKNFDGYGIPWRGDTKLHQKVAWFATEDDRVLDVVIGDRVDSDFGWILLAHVDLVGRANEDDYQTSASGYRAVDMTVSLPTQAVATAELHAAMLATCGG